LHLSNGEKWQADEATNNSIATMIEITTREVEKKDLVSFQHMGADLSREMKALFGVCTMKGESHDQLHVFLVPLVAKFRNLEHAKTAEDAVDKQKNILVHLNKFSKYFK